MKRIISLLAVLMFFCIQVDAQFGMKVNMILPHLKQGITPFNITTVNTLYARRAVWVGNNATPNYYGDLDMTAITDNRSFAFPDVSGTVALESYVDDEIAALNFTNMANTNLSLTADRTHDGDGFFFNLTDANYLGITGGVTKSGLFRIYEDADNGTDYVGLSVAPSVTSSYTLTYPSTPPGANGYVQLVDTDGSSTWSTPPNFTSTNLSASSSRNHDFNGNTLTLSELGNLSLNNGSTGSGILALFEDSDNGTHFMQLTVPSSLSSSLTITLPNGAPAAGQVMTFASNGTASWATVPTITSLSSGGMPYYNGTALTNSNTTYSTITGGRVLMTSAGASSHAAPVRYPLMIRTSATSITPGDGIATGIKFQLYDDFTVDTVTCGYLHYEAADNAFGSFDTKIQLKGRRNNVMVDLFEVNAATNTVAFGGATMPLIIDQTIITPGTTGNATISKYCGRVNFAATDTQLTVTNTLCTANSIVVATVVTDDTTMKSVSIVPGAGSFVITANAAATAETAVNWILME